VERLHLGLREAGTPAVVARVLAAGFLLGRPGEEGMIPSQWVAALVGGNSLQANLFASVVGAFMYFATLTEVPILQGLIGSGMGQGPALSLLLAGPAPESAEHDRDSQRAGDEKDGGVCDAGYCDVHVVWMGLWVVQRAIAPWIRRRTMKKLQILGTGCPKCRLLADATEAAAQELGIEYELEKVTDLNRIMGFGVMLTPALVVDGVVKVSGKVPDIEEIKKMLA
jgi:small redox-active disulfide protein 2